MSLPALTLIPAGAGSGKTHAVQKRLAAWIADGRVRPERIVAVTFTEAAAAELRARIQGELVSQGRIEDALRLESAYISTIHGFGLRLLREYAFEAGLAPQVSLLGQDEEALLISLELARTDRADVVMSRLTDFGYRYDFGSGKSAEDGFRKRVSKLIALLRSLGRSQEDPALAEHARRVLQERYGPTAGAAGLEGALLTAVEDLLESFPSDLSGCHPDNATATAALAGNYRDLRRAAESPEALGADWGLWHRLRGLRLSMRGSPLPEGYDAHANAVMQAASKISQHPGPLADAVRHVEALLDAAQDAIGRYDRAKRERGLLDFTDMIALSRALLDERRDVAEALCDRVDCLVIDEFQDTNPLQFALLWSLHEAGVPALIVGDVKQGIMGFQGADVRLFEQLTRDQAEHAEPLLENWRSTPRLMEVLNRIGTGLFPETYIELEPRASYESLLEPLDVIVADGKIRQAKRELHQAAAHFARRLIGDQAHQVWDPALGQHRRVRGEDIALLAPTHVELDRHADQMRDVGIATRRQSVGWLDSRIVQLMWHALSYVADPGDRHAALYLVLTELGDSTLEEELRRVVAEDPSDDTTRAALRACCDDAAERTVDSMIDTVIDALDLWAILSTWPDAAQARANLLRLRDEARSFAATRSEALASAGLHGFGLKTFLAWLRRPADDIDTQPSARAREQDAVELVTWHAAKGREWPIVIVAGLDEVPSPRLPNLTIAHTNFDDLSRVLDRARIEVTPDFTAPETRDAMVRPLVPEALDGARRLLYVALTRAREKLVLEWPAYVEQKSKPVTTYWSLLKESSGMALTEGGLRMDGEVVPCQILQAGSVEEAEERSPSTRPEPRLPVIGRRGLSPRPVPDDLRPEAVTPSSLHGASVTPSVGSAPRVESYGPPLDLGLDLDALERGDLLHRCFEVLPGRELDAERLEAACGISVPESARLAIVEAVPLFEGWLIDGLSAQRVWREVPVLGMREDSVMAGTADLVAETPDGIWIIDHKSDRVEDRVERFGRYLPQLEAYAEVMGEVMGGVPVAGVGVSWVSWGEVTLLSRPRGTR